jgi:VWFA-related protein
MRQLPIRWHNTTLTLAVLAAAATTAATLAATTSPPRDTSAPADPGAGPQAQEPQRGQTFRAAAEAVFTSLRVLNARGEFVPDLRQDELRVFEDDVEQTVTFFQTWIGGRNLQPVAAADDRDASGLILPPARAPTDASGRIFVIFIDDLHLQAQDTPRARHVLGLIRDTLVHEGDLVGFVSSGYSSIAIDLTYDYGHERFNEVIGKVVGGAPSPFEIIHMPDTSEGPAALRFNAATAFQLADEMLERAAKITDRRKVFLYVSSGYNFSPFEESRFRQEQERYGGTGAAAAEFRDPFAKRGQQFSEADLVAQLAALTRDANRANVTFFAVDPRGLLGGPDIDTRLTTEEWQEHNRVAHGSLRVMSDETGGFCLCNTNDFVGGLKRIDSLTSDYYMIGYTSTNPDPLDVRRRVRIDVTRPGDYELEYRNEYMIERRGSGKR